jgi:hypothetical protein
VDLEARTSLQHTHILNIITSCLLIHNMRSHMDTRNIQLEANRKSGGAIGTKDTLATQAVTVIQMDKSLTRPTPLLSQLHEH